MTEIKPVSSYEPEYQSQTNGIWHDVTKEDFDARRYCPDLFNLRILYPAAAYEALQKKNAELKAENDILLVMKDSVSKSEKRLIEENAAQAKRIEEQQEDNLKQKDLILNFQDQYAKDHAEIESLRKQVKDYEFRFGILKQIDGIRKVIGS